MTDLSELDLWSVPPAPDRPPRPPKKHRHQWRGVEWSEGLICGYCGVPQDIATSRRGKLNRSRGNSIEREVAARLGLARVGHFGGPDDVRGLAFVGQVKSGAAFPERLWRWLRGVPVAADQTRILVITDAPGPGHKRRGLVVLELEDWVALHGETLA